MIPIYLLPISVFVVFVFVFPSGLKHVSESRNALHKDVIAHTTAFCRLLFLYHTRNWTSYKMGPPLKILGGRATAGAIFRPRQVRRILIVYSVQLSILGKGAFVPKEGKKNNVVPYF